ncbi:MAG: hypothetical protein RMY64_32920 [Nostoc sp. DedQUE08]|uniref:hypothetical protein n=1 Tax=unclassified Nostoc TaxID=2593658 RepID=UPI002AD57195|nr:MULTISPECIES: hypothetical protein [unclassified Nostoc]MDZ8070360.1 hypothetical protein [Nostoc sp. DedQUE08]MDZ8096729.1 hypothetical protein [Nostoc sp. DedQUE05]
MSSNFKVTIPNASKMINAIESFEMSQGELEVHFPKEIKILENSPCSAVSIAYPNGEGSIIIEKPKP